MTWTAHHKHMKTIVPKPLGTEAVVLVPRHRAGVFVLLQRQRAKHPFSHSETENEVIRSCSETVSPSREPLEYASGDCHQQLVLSVSTHSNSGWKYEFKTSSLTTTILNLINVAEQNGKSHNFRTYTGPGSNGSSIDKLSLDLKLNPQTCWNNFYRTE